MKKLSSFLPFILLACQNVNDVHFEQVIVGTWQIENPSVQAFVSFKTDGKVLFYPNRFSFELDSLVEQGQWQLLHPFPKQLYDTFNIGIRTQKGMMELQFLRESSHRLKQLNKQLNIYYNRIDWPAHLTQ